MAAFYHNGMPAELKAAERAIGGGRRLERDHSPLGGLLVPD